MNIDELEQIFRDYKLKTNNISTMRVFNQVKSLIEDKPFIESVFEEVFSSKTSLCYLFVAPGKGASASRKCIKYTKEVLIHMIEALAENNIISYAKKEQMMLQINNITVRDVLSQTMKVTYFKTLDDVITFIDKIGEIKFAQLCLKYRYATPYNKEKDLLDIKTICVLAWHGISNRSMAEFKISNLQTIYSKYNIEEKWQLLINNYCNATSLRVLNSAKTRSLDKNDYLFRGKVSLHYTNTQIDKEINNFNDTCLSLDSPHLLSVADLKTNGILARIYNASKRDKEKARKLIVSTNDFVSSERYNYLEKYNVWVDKFYPSKK